MFIENQKYFLFNVRDEFLREVAVMPEEYRNKFLQKLLKRKGAENQKNVKLYKLAVETIETGEYDNWKNGRIASMLTVTPRMLDCHKSRLIAGLREFVLSEKKITKNDSDAVFNHGFLKVAKKNIFRENKILETAGNNLALAANYSKLAAYYSAAGNRRSTVKCLNNLKRIYETDQNDNIKFHVLIVTSLLNKLRKNPLKNSENDLDTLKEILRTAKKLKNKNYISSAYLKLGLFCCKIKNFEKAVWYFSKGYNFCKRNNLENDALVFSSHILIRNFIQDNTIASSVFDSLKSNYEKIYDSHDDISQLLEIEYCYLRILIYLNHPDSDRVSEEFIKRKILSSRKSEGIISWYLELSDRISSSVYNWVISGNNLSVRVDQPMLMQFEKINSQAMFHYKDLQTHNSLAIIYINCIEQEFWKVKEADFGLTELWAKKLKRLVNTYKLNVSSSWFESSLLGLRIFREMSFRKNNEVFKKFSEIIIELIEKLKSSSMPYNIVSDLAKLIFMSQILRTRDFDKEISKIWDWVNENKPDIINAIKKSAVIEDGSLQLTDLKVQKLYPSLYHPAN